MTKLKAAVIEVLKSAAVFSTGATVVSVAIGQSMRRKQLIPEDEIEVGILGAFLGGSIALVTYHLRKRRRNQQYC